MKSNLKVFNTYQSSAGFTLIELLVAMAITSIVVSLAGSGLVTIMGKNSKAEAETLRRVEFNRALDYIAEDVRRASSITTASSYTISSPFPICAVATPILHVSIPGSTPNNIVYYLNDISGCIGNANVWLKPAVIKRVPGVTTVPGVTPTTIPGGNGSELVDAVILDATPNCPADLPNITPAVVGGKVKGFYTCTSSTNSRVVELHLVGKLTDGYGNSLAQPYEVSTRVFARSAP